MLAGRRPRSTAERRLQIAVADRLRADAKPGWFWSHIGHGAKLSKKTAALLQRMGVKPGIPDFLLIAPDGEHCWLELKNADGVLSDPQADFTGMCRARKIPCAVARSYGEAIEVLESWGAI